MTVSSYDPSPANPFRDLLRVLPSPVKRPEDWRRALDLLDAVIREERRHGYLMGYTAKTLGEGFDAGMPESFCEEVTR